MDVAPRQLGLIKVEVTDNPISTARRATELWIAGSAAKLSRPARDRSSRQKSESSSSSGQMRRAAGWRGSSEGLAVMEFVE
jgi:hypothetical protein